jgi:hypothetical protein
MLGVTINIDGVCIVTEFEVVEIVDKKKNYPTLLGLDWDFYNDTMIDIKKRHMVFEVRESKVIATLDPTK